jgi:hypothetical protein
MRHVVASTICFVPKLFVKQILLPISVIFEGEREGGKGSVRRANSVSRSLIAWSALGPSYWRTASAVLDWKFVCNPRISSICPCLKVHATTILIPKLS